MWGTSIATFVLCCFLLLLARSWLRGERKKTARLPPGRMGWPLVGETLELIAAYRTSNPEPFAESRRARYGPVFKTHLLGKPTIFSTDPETNKFVLNNEGRLFAASYPQSLVNLLGKHSLLLTHGDLHKQLYALTWGFTNSSVLKDHLMVDIETHVSRTLDTWTNQIIYIQDEAKKITFDLSVRQLLSVNPGDWTESLRMDYLALIEGFFSLPINLPGTTYGKSLQARAEIAKKVRHVVDERRDGRQVEHHDFLAALLRQNMTDQQVVDLIISLLVASFETTSMIMTLAVKYLTDNPAALKQIRAELNSIKDRKKPGEGLLWSDYKSMVFTQCIINETLRMGNIVGGVFRKALQDVNIKGVTVPKGWVIFSSFRAVHFDEANHSDAKVFNPWRWQGNSPLANCKLNFSPFGGGPRFCPGSELARLEITIFLYHVITQFCWEPAEKDELIFFPTTRTVKRFPVVVTRLQQLHECRTAH